MRKVFAVLILLAIAAPAFPKAATELLVYRYRVTYQDAAKTTIVKESGNLFIKEGFIASTSTTKQYTAADIAAGDPFSATVLSAIADRYVIKLTDYIKKSKSSNLKKFVRSTEKYLIDGVPWVTICVKGTCDKPPSPTNACVL